MRFLLLPVFVAFFASARAIADTDWTYLDILNYAITKGGANHPVALLVEHHVNQSEGVAWTDIYGGDIRYEDTVLTVSRSPHGRHLLAKLNPFVTLDSDPFIIQREGGELPPSTYAIGYPFVDNCNDPVSFTWQNIVAGQCYGYWVIDSVIGEIRMYSVVVGVPQTKSDTIVRWRAFRDDGECQGSTDRDNEWALGAGEHCVKSWDGRGFMSFVVTKIW
jgi:hypothetical protein